MIEKLYTVAEIREKVASNDYNAELMLQHLMARVAELEAERLRFYHADGTFELLASPEEVTKRRVECARRILNLEEMLKSYD